MGQRRWPLVFVLLGLSRPLSKAAHFHELPYVSSEPSAVEAGGGRFLARGNPAQIYDAGLNQRVAVIEFDSVGQAIATHDSAACHAALEALGNGAQRDLRIVEGSARAFP